MGFEVQHTQGDLDELFEIDFKDMAEEALANAVPILEKSMQKAVYGVIEHEGDSELAKSIRASKPKKAKTGAYIINVSPKGNSSAHTYKGGKGKKRKYPVSNALKAIWKEYGINSQNHHQPAQPFLAKATNDAESAVLDTIEKTFDSKLRK